MTYMAIRAMQLCGLAYAIKFPKLTRLGSAKPLVDSSASDVEKSSKMKRAERKAAKKKKRHSDGEPELVGAK